MKPILFEIADAALGLSDGVVREVLCPAACEQTFEMPRRFVGTIAAITFKANDDMSVVVSLADELEGTGATSEYSQDFLAAALVLYCRTCASRPEERPEIGGNRRG